MGRRDDGDGNLREVFKSAKNGRGETSFSVSVIQSRTETEREGGESWRGHLQRQCWAMWGALGAGGRGAGSLQPGVDLRGSVEIPVLPSPSCR